VPAQAPQDFEPVELGQPDIEYQQPENILLERLVRRRPVADPVHCVAGLRERELQRLGERGIVFGQQDAHRRKYTRRPPECAPAERLANGGFASLEGCVQDAGRANCKAAHNPALSLNFRPPLGL